MDLYSCLSWLSDADLEAVVANRPEAAGIHGPPRPALRRLALHLSQPYAIARAAERLDRVHLQLLQLACVLGGRLDRATMLHQGVPPAAIGPAIDDLTRLALAFPDPDLKGMVVPSEVQAAISYRGTIGAQLRPLVEAETAEELARVARAIGVPPARKAELVDAIVSRLSTPAFVRALLDGAPPESRRALEAIRRAGGRTGIFSLRAELGDAASSFGSTWRRRHNGRDESGLVWLWSRGLVFRDEWESTVVIPAPVEVAIRGRAFPTWETSPPELDLGEAAFDRTPLALVEEVSRLIACVTRSEVPMLRSGGIGVRECRRLASETGLSNEDTVRRLLELAWCAELLRVRSERSRTAGRRGRPEPADESRFLTVTAEGRAWLAADPAAAWFRVFDAWRRRGFQLVSPEDDPVAAGEDHALRAIAALPADRAATVESLARRLSWQLPGIWPDDRSAAMAVVSVRRVLALLGVSPTTGAVALSAAGRAAWEGAGVEAIEALLPAGVESCVVQADLTVTVIGPPSVDMAAALSRFADLETSGVARVYRLSERSVARALDQGMSADAIERLLSGHAKDELPSPVRELIRDVGRRHGRVRVGTAAVYVTADDSAVLAEALAGSRARALDARLLAPTVAVIEGRTRAQVVEILRKAGLMPAVEPSAPAPAKPANGRKARPALDPDALERRREALERARAVVREVRRRRLDDG